MCVRRVLGVLAVVTAGLMLMVSAGPVWADEPTPSPTSSEGIESSPSPEPSPSSSESPTSGDSPEPSPEASGSPTALDGWTRDDVDAVLVGVVLLVFMGSLATIAALGR